MPKSNDPQNIQEPLIALRGITNSFSGVIANNHVDLDIYGGEVHALLGENGAGKSVLMKILYGFYRADAGQVLLDGVPPSIRSPHDARKVEILKLLLSDARLLILDEPTTVLAPHEVKALFSVLDNLRKEGYAVILITHKMKEVLECADRISVLRRGRKVGTMAQKRGGMLTVVASVCGTDDDPQNLSSQTRMLEDSGVIVFSSNNTAAHFCCNLILGRLGGYHADQR